MGSSRAGNGSQPGTSLGSAERSRAGSGRQAAKSGRWAPSEDSDDGDRGAGDPGSAPHDAGVSPKPPADTAKPETGKTPVGGSGGAPASGSAVGGVGPADDVVAVWSGLVSRIQAPSLPKRGRKCWSRPPLTCRL